jgi:hypothetical protein
MLLIIASLHRNSMIPDLLRQQPHLRPILDRYGLNHCGGPHGPVETLAFFARAHDVPVEQLLNELRSATLPAQPSPNPSPHRADSLYRLFFSAGILTVLTLGATWGALLLLRIAWTGSFRAVGLHEVNAHGHAQIFGWVGLFVMGFAYQAFPRFKHTTLRWPSLAVASFWLMLLGLVSRTLAEAFAEAVPGLQSVAWLGGMLEVAAIACFVAIITATFRASGKPLAFYDYYILAALVWFLIQAIFDVVYTTATLRTTDPELLLSLVAAWQGPLREIQIHGFALLIILGVSQRLFPNFYGMAAPKPGPSLFLLVTINLAILGEIAGFILMRSASHAWAILWYLSVIVLVVSVVVLVRHWHLFRPAAGADRNLKFLRAAYVWLFISLTMLALIPFYQFALLPTFNASGSAAQIGFSHAYYGAIRHAITVGFVSLMIVGVASKVVPTLNGLDVRSLTPLWGPFILLNTGCALRVLNQTLTDFTVAAFPLAGLSGCLEVIGLALWGWHLLRILGGWIKTPQEIEESRPRLEAILPETRVRDVLTTYPELLPVFLEFGFRPLANPFLLKTLARRITLAEACRKLEVDQSELLTALNAQKPPRPAAKLPLPLLPS